MVDAPADDPGWSVIIIARNESARIARSIESVECAMRNRLHEVIVVDSASTDDTVTIVERYPVTVVRIPADFPRSPAAGRHVGFLRARYERLLFLDGDSRLEEPWIDVAEDAFTDPTVAGVAGARAIVDEQSGELVSPNQYGNAGEVDCLGGPAAYKRRVLLETGGFNPFLRAYEEAELGGRLRAAGFRLVRLSQRMTIHFTEHRAETVQDLFRRARSGYLLGRGQLLRYGLEHRCVARQHLEGLARLAVFNVLVTMLICGLVAIVLGREPMLALLSGSALAVAFVAFAIRTRSLSKPAYYFLEWAVQGPMFALGFLRCPKSSAMYPVVTGIGRETASAEQRGQTYANNLVDKPSVSG